MTMNPNQFGPYTEHPVAALFPLLDPKSDAFNFLIGSILSNGLLNPIVLSENRIVDGRNRYLACVAANREPRFVQFTDLGLPLNEDGARAGEAEYAFDQNFARRDLTDDQRTAIAVAYEKLLDDIERVRRGAAKGNRNAAKDKKSNEAVSPHLISGTKKARAPQTRTKAAAKAGVSEHKMRQAMSLAKSDPAALAQVAAGRLKLKDATPKPKQFDPVAFVPDNSKNEFADAPDRDYEAHRREVAQLPKNWKAKFERVVEREMKRIALTYEDDVRQAADAMIPERVAHFKKTAAECEVQRKSYVIQRKGLSSLLIEADFRFLLNATHPDRAPDREKLTECFRIISKLQPYVWAANRA